MDSNLDPDTLSLLKIKLRKAYPQLTAADLTAAPGNEMKMLTLVAYKLRMTRQQMQDIIDRL
jgi:hypothetical protein